MVGNLIKKEDSYFLAIPGESTNKFIASIDGMYVDYKLSIKNCIEIENGYHFYYLIEDNFNGLRDCIVDKDVAEFYIHLVKLIVNEALNQNKFNEEHMRVAYDDGMSNIDSDGDPIDNPDDDFNDTIQSLQQKSWEVEILTEFKTEEETGTDLVWGREVPKLDKDGCLILKQKI